MKIKDNIFLIIDKIINEHKQKELFEFYGDGSSIRIKTIGYSTNSKSLYVEAHLTIGENFSDEILDTSLAEILITDALNYVYPNCKTSFIFTFDS